MTAWRSSSATGGDISWLGNLADHEIYAKSGQAASNKTTTWLPEEAFAKAWQTFTTGGKSGE
ncbi:MAG: hypothetical protein LBK60_01895 [Verrucomicrobiales bacterium]|nr:hypothetical protein [Verrucomicrobiales bacterium]